MTKNLSPGGTVTLLLGDVEGSARLWEADRDGTKATMARLEEIVADATRTHGGERPREQGEGDNFVIGFSRASEAAGCALAIQHATARESWPHGGNLRIRMALNSGELDGAKGRFDGTAINRCARMRDLAHGGQVLVSRATHDLIEDRLPADATLTGLGAHRLRDLARPEEIFQLSDPELTGDFPPLRSLDELPNNLPIQLTAFIGRAKEMDALRQVLEEARLVTLTGAGGCGKTRLAMQVAADLLDRHPEGVWWVDLASITDPALAPAAVAAALKLKEVPGRTLIDTLKDHIRPKRIMILLDNCEHMSAAAASLTEELLRECPGLTVLATSREPLAIEGEIDWRVPSLSLPDTGGSPGVAGLSQFEAVRLFIDRALRVRPNFRVTNDNAPAVAGICSRLDGVPLAIELAAARVRMMTPEQITEGLDDRFHLLTGGTRSMPPRHQTLEASVDWSHELLADTERMLFRRLSVFVGSFDIDAAESVCAGSGIDRVQVLDLVTDIADRSLLQVEAEGPRARYRMLETIRQFASDRLEGSGERSDVRSQHLGYYAQIAEREEPEFLGPEPAAAATRLDLEHGNLRAALAWSLESDRTDQGLRIVGAMWGYWVLRGLFSEGRAWADELLRKPADDDAVRSWALHSIAELELFHGDYPKAREWAAEAVELARGLGDPRLLVRALNELGFALAYLEPEAAPPVLAEAIQISKEQDERFDLGYALLGTGVVELFSGDAAEACRQLQESVAAFRSEESLWNLAISLLFLGHSHLLLGDLAPADESFTDGLTLACDLGDALVEGACRLGRADLALYKGDLDRTAAVLEQVPDDLSLGPFVLAARSVSAGNLALARGDLEAADARGDQALTLTRAIGIPIWIVRAAESKVDIALTRGDLAPADQLVEEALKVSTKAGGLARAAAFEKSALVARARGEHQESEDALHEALRVLTGSNVRLFVPDVLEALAGIAVEMESYEEAARLVGAAERQREKTGYARLSHRCTIYDLDVSSLRDALPEEDLEPAWAEGRAMTLEEAVAYAARGRGERKRPSSGWASLTPTEMQVVKHAAEGLTNPQIAERMFVSRATVKAHLSHIFAKLGVATRAELAAAAARREI